MKDIKEIDVSIVIACYNDAPHLKKNFRQIVEIMNSTKYSFEIIFIDDKSPDNSKKIIEEIIHENPSLNLRGIFHEKNMGRGRSVSDGITAARGRIAGFLDIDLEVHARYLPAVLLEVDKGADLALARRVFDLNFHSLARFFFSKGYIRLSSRVLKMKGIDSESGFKFFNKKTMEDVLRSIKDNHWFWDTEVVYKARLANKRITEVPALFMRSPHKKSTVNITRDIYYYLVKLWAARKELRP
jgi:glycosyltransferase involved in cell wall biosynthesis